MNAPPPENLRPISLPAERLFSCYVFSLSLTVSSLPCPLFLSLSISRSISLSFRPPADGNSRAETRRPRPTRDRALARSLFRPRVPPRPPPFSLPVPPSSSSCSLSLSLSLARSLFRSGPLFPRGPPSSPHSHRHRNSGWKSLNCTHSHARASFALMALSPGEPPSPRPPSALSLSRPSMTLVELSTRVIPRILACVRVRGVWRIRGVVSEKFTMTAMATARKAENEFTRYSAGLAPLSATATASETQRRKNQRRLRKCREWKSENAPSRNSDRYRNWPTETGVSDSAATIQRLSGARSFPESWKRIDGSTG